MLFGVRGTGGWGECLLGDGPLTISARACTRYVAWRVGLQFLTEEEAAHQPNGPSKHSG